MKRLTFSIFEYFYRDASNFKVWGSLLLSGKPSKNLLQQIVRKLESSEFFIAEQIGVPPLYLDLLKISGGPTSSDHTWHTFYCFRMASPEEVNLASVWGTSTEIASRFNNVEKWDFTQSNIWLNVDYQSTLISTSGPNFF